jgi:hypothetical protein
MRKQKYPVEAGEVVTAPDRYILKKAIVYGGIDKKPGDEVKLDDRQAERLKQSDYI